MAEAKRVEKTPKPKVKVHLTLTEEEAEFLQYVTGEVVSWAVSSPEAHRIYHALRRAGVDCGEALGHSVLDRSDMIAVTK